MIFAACLPLCGTLKHGAHQYSAANTPVLHLYSMMKLPHPRQHLMLSSLLALVAMQPAACLRATGSLRCGNAASESQHFVSKHHCSSVHFDRRAYTPSSYGAQSDSQHRCNQRSAGSYSGASCSSLVRGELHGCTVCDSFERALRFWRLFVQQPVDHLQRH